ncbi:E3 ubiquitin-protein ligase TRIM21-like [Toxotes jaculatrix]|uniref:E3 ubiquitin-protein ligase TRIM21-like n=1 Tax=Toxotes jaculatrix TaxID=941984 RepID=UPI001B3B129F|nr:E3 ubiquitin-protein ligase TRIM21-like [Toxotes jaculatrix]
MASSLNLLSEEQLLCPICLDTLNKPVSTPCGHNFCLSCLTSYWNNETVCQCPVCKETFERRPNLKVNTFISELASQFMLLQATDAHIWSPDQLKITSGSVVLCDICTDTRQEAVKSCLECLTSYCNVHVEPHHRAAGLKRHTLVDPLASLEDKICKEHNQLLTLFCRNDKVLLCGICASSHHASHGVVLVQRAYQEMKDLLGDAEAIVQQMIQERQQKVQAMKESVKQSKRETKDVIANAVQELTALVSEVQKSQTKFVKVIEEKQKAEEEEVDGFIGNIKQELTELQRTTVKLRELKETKDQFAFLQNFPHPSLLPHVRDLSSFRFNRHLEIQHIQKSLSSCVSQLQSLLNKFNTEVNESYVSNVATLRYLQQYDVNILLDPDTAHPLLILSEDRKQVRYSMGSGLWANQNMNPNTFTEHLAVLGQRGFLSRKFYFEVSVGQKTEWCLGVATASVQRRGALVRSPNSGLWAIWFLEDKFETFCCPGMTVFLGKVEKVGVFVDYDGGQISFYDVQTATLIYSFTECIFFEELYPYLNPCDNEYGSNLDPMVIVPVSHME